jgi:hypothetical protein
MQRARLIISQFRAEVHLMQGCPLARRKPNADTLDSPRQQCSLYMVAYTTCSVLLYDGHFHLIHWGQLIPSRKTIRVTSIHLLVVLTIETYVLMMPDNQEMPESNIQIRVVLNIPGTFLAKSVLVIMTGKTELLFVLDAFFCQL